MSLQHAAEEYMLYKFMCQNVDRVFISWRNNLADILSKNLYSIQIYDGSFFKNDYFTLQGVDKTIAELRTHKNIYV